MHNPKDLIFSSIDSVEDPLSLLEQTRQVEYLRSYMRTLGALSIVEEQQYFDRDYLDEFASFYSLSSRGYPNTCRRLHFFSSDKINRDYLQEAAAEESEQLAHMQESYLGFCVIRPIPATPLGRTVFKWFPDLSTASPRVTTPSRVYTAHLAGITLQVVGLAWQQQDTGVGACATVGLWTALHSSAFDDHHAVPTTAEITKSAHEGASLGARVFPSTGLSVYQLLEAVKAQNLAPIWCAGDIQDNGIVGFTKERFASTCASFIRSGYPVLIWGQHLDPKALMKHVVCAVGFREETPPIMTNPGCVSLQDGEMKFIYIHDDNLGPSVRFKVIDNGVNTAGLPEPVTICADSPPSVQGNSPTVNYPEIRPEAMCVAVHECIRSSTDILHSTGKDIAHGICGAINVVLAGNKLPGVSLSVSTRFITLADYMGVGLGVVLGGKSSVLGRVRLALAEKCPPMSLHVAVIRVALSNATPLVDFIYDTTDTDRNHPAFAHVIYDKQLVTILSSITGYGVSVHAF